MLSSDPGFKAVIRKAVVGVILAAAPLALSACGFHTVYGDHSLSGKPSTRSQMASVSIDIIPDRIGQMLRNNLIDRFYQDDGRPVKPDYRLNVRMNSYKEDLGIQRDATATRARLHVMADYQLIDNKTGKTLYRTSSRSIVSYDISEAQYSTMVTEQDAYDRALTELAEEITTRLSLYFDRGSVVQSAKDK
ncbi:LPS assembly lipoprotein LptE [Nitrospirillum pindoramense]|uniref:LPS-assembly lipoprotein n=1 Tax=Nitrospirillum amazonense TaxID=28077 RepID=A0A560GRX5_9PROT|nr:LPS assembly lipoprotein LptE [Nitrospirillum amazonense]TWB36788.1 LPS-assembly lipoprotein [Nitrospirillum amazonense]